MFCAVWMFGTWRCITDGISTILSMYWTCGNSTVFCTSESQAPVMHHDGHVHHRILELHLEYPNNVLDLLDGRDLSPRDHRTFTALSMRLPLSSARPAPMEPVESTQQEHRPPFHCVATVESLWSCASFWKTDEPPRFAKRNVFLLERT